MLGPCPPPPPLLPLLLPALTGLLLPPLKHPPLPPRLSLPSAVVHVSVGMRYLAANSAAEPMGSNDRGDRCSAADDADAAVMEDGAGSGCEACAPT